MIDLAGDEGWLNLARCNGSKEFLAATARVELHLGALRAWANSKDPLATAGKWEKEGHDAAVSLLPEIHSHLKKRCSLVLADPAKTYSRIGSLFDRLSRRIPPDNFGSDQLEPNPPALEDILATAWWYRTAQVPVRFEDGDLAPESRQAAEVLRRLTLKAVENIDFYQRFCGDVKAARSKPPLKRT
jgi:hypothetical protein